MTEKMFAMFVENTIIFIVLLIAVLLLKTVLKKQLTAKLQYLLWGIVIIKLLVPFSISTQWSPYMLVKNAVEDIPVEVEEPVNRRDNYAVDTPVLEEKPTEKIKVPTLPSLEEHIAQIEPAAETKPSLKPIEPAESAVPIDWTVLAVSVWFLGFAVFSFLYVFKAHKLKKTVIRCQTGISPKWMEKVLKECEYELGIDQNIRLIVQGALPVPAVMGVINPILIVPEKLAKKKDIEKLRHVFMHEMMHVKRKDLMVIWVLNLLTAVYWFNPLVWLCFKQIHRDMEAACDAMVVEKLGVDNRQRYIHTILQFCGRNEHQQVQVGMNLNDGCMEIQERIRSMYMRTKMKKRTKVGILAFSLVMTFSAFTTGCQATPEDKVILQKDAQEFEEAIAKTPVPEKEYDAPEKYTGSFSCKDEKVKVSMDAEIVVPDVLNYPVIRIEPAEVTTDMMKTGVAVLLEGKPVYPPKTQLTKADIENEILNLRQALADPANSKSDGLQSDDPEAVAQTKKLFEDRIKIYEELYDTAPDKLETKEAQIVFVPAKFYEDPVMYAENIADWTAAEDDEQAQELLDMYENEMKLLLRAELDDGYVGALSASNYSSNTERRNIMKFGKSRVLYATGGPDVNYENFKKTTMTEDEAIQLGKDLLSSMNINNMELSDSFVYWVCDKDTISDDVSGYELVFQPTYGDIRVLDDPNATHSEKNYDAAYQNECINMTITDEQVVSFIWVNPTQEVATDNQNVELKPFDEITQLFEKQMSLEYNVGKLTSGDGNDIISANIDITRVELGAARIDVPDKVATYRMVPVWKFYGTHIVEYKNDDNPLPSNESEYLTINAIDGSIINTDLGY